MPFGWSIKWVIERNELRLWTLPFSVKFKLQSRTGISDSPLSVIDGVACFIYSIVRRWSHTMEVPENDWSIRIGCLEAPSASRVVPFIFRTSAATLLPDSLDSPPFGCFFLSNLFCCIYIITREREKVNSYFQNIINLIVILTIKQNQCIKNR